MHSFKYIVSSKSKIKGLGGSDVAWLVKDGTATTDTVQQNFIVLLFPDHNNEVWEVWQHKLGSNLEKLDLWKPIELEII